MTGAVDLVTSDANVAIAQATFQQKLVKDNTSKDNVLDTNFVGRITTLTNLSRASSALSGGIKDISRFLEKSKAPSPHLQAELDKLRSADPQYTKLVGDIKDLLTERRRYVDDLLQAIGDVASASDLITRDILAIDGLSVDIGNNANLIDSRVNAYLKDMERRAFDRLLRYHYYMAKAYEYRVVKPYLGTLDAKPLFDKISQIISAGTTPNGVLDAATRDLIKKLFTDPITALADQIYTDFSSDPLKPTEATLPYPLSPSEVASLNRGEAITLNFFNLGRFLPSDDDIRIVDLKLDSAGGMGTRVADGYPLYDVSSYIDLCIQHSGFSNLKMKGEVYQFRHYSQATPSKIQWKTTYKPRNNTVQSHTKPHNDPSDSLLYSLLTPDNLANVDLYSSPSAWADLKIWRQGVYAAPGAPTIQFLPGTPDNSNAPIVITNVTLELTYSRLARTPYPWGTLEVVPAHEDSPGKFIEDNAMVPYFILSSPDRDFRQDAQGHFLRMYSGTPSTIQLSAQDPYGSLAFYRWSDNGHDLGNNSTISLASILPHRILAEYVSVLPIPIAINRTGGQTILSWHGGVGVKLQWRSCLSNACPWQDVPNTDGQSSASITPSLAWESYFRLVRIR